jgi:CRP-like cAMP-binding protein
MQMGGTGLRMEFKRFEQMFADDTSLNAAVLRLVQYEALALAQLSACNRLHEMEARLSRWLLMVADRTGGTEMRLTQEFLGEMLGTRRSTVNITVGSLQKAGLIDYRRSCIRIESRQGLEGVACECYPIVRKLLRQMYKGLPAT